MVVEIIESSKIDGHDFIDGQEYKSLGKVYVWKDNHDFKGNIRVLHYALQVEGRTVPIFFPADMAAGTSKTEPKSPNTSRWEDLHKEMTEDAVVKDGDYAKAILERLDVDITDVGPHYNMKKLNELLAAYQRHNAKANENRQGDPTERTDGEG